MEETVILKVDTGQSEMTVKDLKNEINGLRDSILNLDKGTDEYDKAVNKLQKDQRKLDEVMSLTKKNAVALDGSYDALVKKMAKLKKEWKATNDEAKRDELGKQIASINEELKDMDASIGNFQRNVGDYTNSIVDAFDRLNEEIGEFENKAAQAYQTGDLDAYADAISEIGRRQGIIDKINEDSDFANGNMTKKLENLTNVASGVAAGFGAVQSIMVLAGRDTEDFEKTMVKLQATISLVQGLQGISGMIKSLKGLRIALAATRKAILATAMAMGPAGWVAAIGALTVALGAFLVKLKETKDEAKALESHKERVNEFFNVDLAKNNIIKSQLDSSNDDITAKKQRIDEISKIQEAIGDSRLDVLERKFMEYADILEEKGMIILRMQKNLQDVTDKELDFRMSEAIGTDKTVEENYGEEYAQEFEKSITKYNASISKALQEYEELQKEFDEIGEQWHLLVFENFAKTDELLKNLGAKDLNEVEKIMAEREEIVKFVTRSLEDMHTIEVNETGEDKPFNIDHIIKAIDEHIAHRINDVVSTVPEIEDTPIDDDIDFTTDSDKKKGQARALARAKIQNAELEARKEFNAVILLNEEERAKGELDIEQRLSDEKVRIMKEAIAQATADGDIEGAIALKSELANLEIEIERDKNEKIAQDRENARREDEESFRETQEHKKEIAMASMQAIGTFLQVTAELYQQNAEAQVKAGKISEKEYIKQMKKVKAMQIAEATINTIAGAVGAFMGITKDTGGWGIALAAIQAAAVTALGVAQIARIKNTDISSPNADMGGGSYGNVTPPQMPNPYETNSVRNLTGQKEMEELNKDQRVILVESDIEESRRRVKVREEESTF